MKTQHTPGPWKVLNDLSSWHLVPIDAECGKHIGLAFTGPPYPEAEANARLIAAAPDLLAALVGLTRIVGDYRQRVMEGQITGNLIEHDCAPYFAGLDAIIKATGEHQV